MKKIKVLISACFLVINSVLSAETRAELSGDFTPEKISSFACSLIGKSEYYRAYVEILRLKSYYPSYLDPAVYHITADYLFYKSRKYTELISRDFEITGDDMLIPASLFRLDSLIKLKKTDAAESELKKLYKKSEGEKYSAYLNKRAAYLSIMDFYYKGDFFKEKLPDYKELYLYAESIHRDRKNPCAGLLAGIIPGMGYVYAGETGTGILSAIVIGLGSAVACKAYSEHWDSMAVVSGLITFFFYGGSIAGGYMQSVKHNRRLDDTLQMKLERELMPERDLDEIYFKFGLSSNDCK